MEIVLTAIDGGLLAAWKRYCSKLEGVSVLEGSITDLEVDAVISPANSFGFMDGGIDSHYTNFFGHGIEAKLQRTIREEFDGELLVGQAVLVATQHSKIPYLIAAPTMRVPMVLLKDTLNPYLATKAAIRCAKVANEVLSRYSGDPKARSIQRLAFPGMGTGIGGLHPTTCAYQVARAIEEVLHGKTLFPPSFEDAIFQHERLLAVEV